MNASSEPALVLAVGARVEKGSARYPVEEIAVRHKAGVPDPRTTAAEACAAFGEPTPGPPPVIFTSTTVVRGTPKPAAVPAVEPVRLEVCDSVLRERADVHGHRPREERPAHPLTVASAGKPDATAGGPG